MTDRTRRRIAADLGQGAGWIRSFSAAGTKGVLDEMILDGEAVRVKPPNGAARNMVGLTAAGAAKYLPGVDVMTYEYVPSPTRPRRQYTVSPDRTAAALRAQAEREAIEHRTMLAEARRADERDRLADFVADGGSMRAASAALGISKNSVERRWNEIKDGLGWQAQ